MTELVGKISLLNSKWLLRKLQTILVVYFLPHLYISLSVFFNSVFVWQKVAFLIAKPVQCWYWIIFMSAVLKTQIFCHNLPIHIQYNTICQYSQYWCNKNCTGSQKQSLYDAQQSARLPPKFDQNWVEKYKRTFIAGAAKKNLTNYQQIPMRLDFSSSFECNRNTSRH